MKATRCTENVPVTLAECAFTRKGYTFMGWATEATALPEAVAYHPGDVVTNMTMEDEATVTLYAVWSYLPLVEPVITPTNGAMFEETCSVSIACESADAVIYYSTSGRTPSLTETYRYKGAFTITKTTTVTAVAVRGEEKSAYVKTVISKQTETLKSEVPVPFAWLKEKYPTLPNVAAYEAKANEIAANGVNKVWECFLAGLDPKDVTAKFVANVKIENGKPVLTWSPDLNEGKGRVGARVYKLMGSNDLKAWTEVPEGSEANYHFFKVKVALP